MESVGHARSGLQDCRRGGRGGTGILTYIHALIPRNMRYTPYIHTIQHNTHTRFRPDLVILAAGGVVMTVCTLGSPSCRRPVPVDSRDGRWVVDAQKADCQTSGVCLYVFTASADPHPKPRGFAATGRRDLLSKHISSLRRASARRLFAAGLPPHQRQRPFSTCHAPGSDRTPGLPCSEGRVSEMGPLSRASETRPRPASCRRVTVNRGSPY